MRRSLSILAAAVMAVAGAAVSFTPAQAITARAAPALSTQATVDTGIVKVHERRWRGRGWNRPYGYYRPDRRYYRYPKYYRHYGYYKPRRYYYRSRPSFSFGFSFGTPGYNHYRW